MAVDKALYPWYGSVLIVGVVSGAIRPIQTTEWPSLIESLTGYA